MPARTRPEGPGSPAWGPDPCRQLGNCGPLLAGSPPRTGPGGPASLDSPPRTGPGGPWNLQAWGPRTPENVCFGLFRKIGGVAPSDRPRRPRVPGICQPGAPEPLGVPPDPQNCRKCVFWPLFEVAPSERPRRPRVPGICQPGAPDPPGGTPQTPQKTKTTSMVRDLIWGPSLLRNGKRSIAWLSHYSPRIPGGFTLLTVLTGRSAGGLGRSLERPCKWSAALSAV